MHTPGPYIRTYRSDAELIICIACMHCLHASRVSGRELIKSVLPVLPPWVDDTEREQVRVSVCVRGVCLSRYRSVCACRCVCGVCLCRYRSLFVHVGVFVVSISLTIGLCVYLSVVFSVDPYLKAAS